MGQASMVPCLVIALHLIEMVRDAIDLLGRILDGQDRTIRGLGCFVRSYLRLRRGLLGMRRSLLSLGCRCFGLLGLLLIVRRASRDRDSQYQNG
jgi:hypothetical protein